MPRIPYKASTFPDAMKLNGSGFIEATWSDIVWAAISVGKCGVMDLLAHGPFSYREIMWRAYMVFANLRQDSEGRIVRSDAYEALDPSEKGAVSFFLGMAFAKLVADKLLNTPTLVHVDKIRTLYPVSFLGKSKPDLVGRDVSGDWLVMEAKGRTNGYSEAAMVTAKAQSKQVTSIGMCSKTSSGKSVLLFAAIGAASRGSRWWWRGVSNCGRDQGIS